MNKFQFIKHLIDHKKFTPSQKERFFKLVSSELGNTEEKDQKIQKEIQMIKKHIGLDKRVEKNNFTVNLADFDSEFQDELWDEISNAPDNMVLKSSVTLVSQRKVQQNIQNKPFSKTKTAPDPNPKHVADFMSLFNQRDGLKYLTHDFDENSNFEIDKFLISAKKFFDNETYTKLNIPPSLWIIVKKFAFDSKQASWASISEDYKKNKPIKIGWASQELRDWSKQNQLHPIRNEEYKKVINDFKRITRVETSNLDKLISTVLDSVFEQEIECYDIEKIDLQKADFYSHVGNLKKGFEAIFEEIKKRSDLPHKKKVSIKYERAISDDGYYLRIIKITHHKSFPTKELSLILKEWQEKGNMGKIRENLNGYCHWSIETMIEDKPTRVNLLREKTTVESEQVEFDPAGFTHILTFYYK